MTSVYILLTRNYWRNPSGSVLIIGVATSLNVALRKLEEHAHKLHAHNSFCDFCNKEWKISTNQARAAKLVDHDGASVEYVAQRWEVYE